MILTENGDELCLWACQPDLKLTLLLRDNEKSKLDPGSFFDFVKVSSRIIDEECDEVSQELALVCSTGDRKKVFSLYKMPEFKQETEEDEMPYDYESEIHKVAEITGFQKK